MQLSSDVDATVYEPSVASTTHKNKKKDLSSFKNINKSYFTFNATYKYISE